MFEPSVSFVTIPLESPKRNSGVMAVRSMDARRVSRQMEPMLESGRMRNRRSGTTLRLTSIIINEYKIDNTTIYTQCSASAMDDQYLVEYLKWYFRNPKGQRQPTTATARKWIRQCLSAMIKSHPQWTLDELQSTIYDPNFPDLLKLDSIGFENLPPEIIGEIIGDDRDLFMSLKSVSKPFEKSKERHAAQDRVRKHTCPIYYWTIHSNKIDDYEYLLEGFTRDKIKMTTINFDKSIGRVFGSAFYPSAQGAVKSLTHIGRLLDVKFNPDKRLFVSDVTGYSVVLTLVEEIVPFSCKVMKQKWVEHRKGKPVSVIDKGGRHSEQPGEFKAYTILEFRHY